MKRRLLVCSKIVNLSGKISNLCAKQNIALDKYVEIMNFNVNVKQQNYSAQDEEELERFLNELERCQIVIADPPVIAKSFKVLSERKLKEKIWIQSTWAGVDAIANAFENFKDSEQNFVMTRLGEVLSGSMSEYVLGQIIANERQFYKLKQSQDHLQWGIYDNHNNNNNNNNNSAVSSSGTTAAVALPYGYRSLKDLTLGILGFGSIGQEICRAAEFGFFMNTVAWVRSKKDQQSFSTPVLKTHQCTEIESVLQQSDYIVSCLPSTKETRHLLNGNVLENCKKGAVFMNVGRGDVISESALLDALEKGWISSACLDVFAPTEPLPVTSALWKHPKVIITPHVSAVTQPDDAATVFVNNLRIYIADSYSTQNLQHIIDFNKGY